MDAATVRALYGGMSDADVQNLVGADQKTAALLLEIQTPPSARKELQPLFGSCQPYQVTGHDSAADVRKFLMDFSRLQGKVPSNVVPQPGSECYECFRKVDKASNLASLIGILVSPPAPKGLGEEYVAAETIHLQTIWSTMDLCSPTGSELGIEFGKNVVETGTQYFNFFKPGLMPDGHATCDGSLLLYDEEKKDDGDFEVAVSELRSKLAEHPSFLYGKLKFVLCYSSTPSKIQFYMMKRSESGPLLEKVTRVFEKADPLHRIQIVLVTLNLYFLLLGMLRAVDTQPLYHLYSDAVHGRSIVTLTLTGCRKIIPGWDDFAKEHGVEFETIKQAYAAARHSDNHLTFSVAGPRLVKASEAPETALMSINDIAVSTTVVTTSSSSGGSAGSQGKRRSESSSSTSAKKRKCHFNQSPDAMDYVVETMPLCGIKIPKTEAELREMAAGVLRALRALHDRGLVHRDIREPNVMYDYERSKYVLIDLESVCKSGKGATIGYNCWDSGTLDDNGFFTTHSDYQLLGLLLSSYDDFEKSPSCLGFIKCLLSKQEDASKLLENSWFNQAGLNQQLTQQQ